MFYKLGMALCVTLLTSTVLAQTKPACTTEASCFKAVIKWDVLENHPTNVCHNYGLGDWRYRQCRMQAQTLFKQRCKEFRQQEKKSQDRTREHNRQMVQHYCIDFRP